jgi:Fe2+ transport system protein FeoA
VNTCLSTLPVQDTQKHPAYLCPLSRVIPGTAVRIKRVSAPPEVSNRLREMGFCEDQPIKLVSRQPTLICQVSNTRLGLSKELADNIFVEMVPVRRG